jgi:hypothetical protein
LTNACGPYIAVAVVVEYVNVGSFVEVFTVTDTFPTLFPMLVSVLSELAVAVFVIVVPAVPELTEAVMVSVCDAPTMTAPIFHIPVPDVYVPCEAECDT